MKLDSVLIPKNNKLRLKNNKIRLRNNKIRLKLNNRNYLQEIISDRINKQMIILIINKYLYKTILIGYSNLMR